MRWKILGAGAAAVWFFVVFLIAFRATFPGQAARDRAQWEMQRASNGAYALQMDTLAPSWAGVKATNVKMRRIPRGSSRGDDGPDVVFAADSAWARIHLLPLLTGNQKVSGGIAYGEGALDFVAWLQQTDQGLTLADLDLGAQGFPLSSLPPLGGVQIEGQGALDLSVDVEAPDGMRKSNGKATLYGEDLQIEELTAPDFPMLASFDLQPVISELDLALEITEGRAKVTRGRLVSDLFELDLSGEVVLLDDLSRSRLRLKAQIKLGESVKMFKSFLKDAEQPDGSFVYRVTGTAQSPAFRAEGTRSRSTTHRPEPTEDSPNAEEPQQTDENRLDEIEERRRRREELRAQRSVERARTPNVVRPPNMIGPGTMPPRIEPPGAGDELPEDEEDPLPPEEGDEEDGPMEEEEE